MSRKKLVGLGVVAGLITGLMAAGGLGFALEGFPCFEYKAYQIDLANLSSPSTLNHNFHATVDRLATEAAWLSVARGLLEHGLQGAVLGAAIGLLFSTAITRFKLRKP